MSELFSVESSQSCPSNMSYQRSNPRFFVPIIPIGSPYNPIKRHSFSQQKKPNKFEQNNEYLSHHKHSKQILISGWTEQIHQPRGTLYIFHSFKIPKSSILKQLEIKIVGVVQDLKKLQIDKQRTHMHLKLYNYKDCWFS